MISKELWNQIEGLAKSAESFAEIKRILSDNEIQNESVSVQYKVIEQKLYHDKNFLENIINSIPTPVFIKDMLHNWIILNDSFCSFMGYKRQELLGKSDYDFFPREEADVFWYNDNKVLINGEELANIESFTDSKQITKTILTRKRLYVDDFGNKYIVGVITDITQNTGYIIA